MMQSHEENSRLPIDPGIWKELCGLLARVCDDDLSESDRLRLNQILDADSAARRYYLQYIAVHTRVDNGRRLLRRRCTNGC